MREVGNEISARPEVELAAANEMRDLLLRTVPQMGPAWDSHLPVFLRAPVLARLLWIDLVYKRAIDVPGCLVDFGSHWGASLNTFVLLKLIHEPWNASRRILSFSTFGDGILSSDAEDGRVSRPETTPFPLFGGLPEGDS